MVIVWRSSSVFGRVGPLLVVHLDEMLEALRLVLLERGGALAPRGALRSASCSMAASW
jgi:hypothetical protein